MERVLEKNNNEIVGEINTDKEIEFNNSNESRNWRKISLFLY